MKLPISRTLLNYLTQNDVYPTAHRPEPITIKAGNGRWRFSNRHAVIEFYREVRALQLIARIEGKEVFVENITNNQYNHLCGKARISGGVIVECPADLK